MLSRISAAAVFALVMTTAPARAVTITPTPPVLGSATATFQIPGLSVDNNTFPVPHSELSPPFFGDDAAIATGFPNPGISLAGSQSATASEQYLFELNGRSGVSIPVYVQGESFLSVNGLFSQASADVIVAGNFVAARSLESSAADAAHDDFPFNTRITVLPNVPIQVVLAVEISTLINGDSSSARIDPTISIDPTFADASQYTLSFSDGIGNEPISAAPLPAALPLFGSGVIALAGLAWRKRAKVSA